MILGYVMIPSDNKYNMYNGIILEKCANYMDIYSLNILNPTLQIKTKKNISYTYDGFIIVSESFKQFCDKEKYIGLEFIQLPKSHNFYWFKINNITLYDTEARETEFINYNEECNGYEEIIGSTPVCLKDKKPLHDGFYRTNICFGSHATKSPLYLVGEPTRMKLQEAGFMEIHFQKILDKYSWQK